LAARQKIFSGGGEPGRGVVQWRFRIGSHALILNLVGDLANFRLIDPQ
jgi:hypothetical protein